MIKIDGASGEGGGQVVRTALTLAVLTGQPTHIHHIRANRRRPGLAPQHLTGVQAMARICRASMQGAHLRSTALIFEPQAAPQPGDYTFDVAEVAQGGSAGSISLVFQTLLLPLWVAAGPSQVILKGGTHVAWSPPFDYLTEVYLPTLARCGLHVTTQLDAWGFYPVGGGQITAHIPGHGSRLQPLTLTERGSLLRVQGRGVACELPAHIPQRMVNRAANVLREAGLPVEIVPSRVRGRGPGAGLFLTATYAHAVAGFSGLGARGKPAPEVADEACRPLLAHHNQGAPVDEHLADQLLLPLALAGGHSEFRTSRITQHLVTNAHIIRQFIPAQITISGSEGQPGSVSVVGVGFAGP